MFSSSWEALACSLRTLRSSLCWSQQHEVLHIPRSFHISIQRFPAQQLVMQSSSSPQTKTPHQVVFDSSLLVLGLRKHVRMYGQRDAGRFASPSAHTRPPERTDLSLRHQRKWAVAWTTTNARSLASCWRSCDSCRPHKTRTTLLVFVCSMLQLGPRSKPWHQQHKCRIKPRAGCAPRIHRAEVSAVPVGVSYGGRATETTISGEGLGNVMYGANRNYRFLEGPAWSL